MMTRPAALALALVLVLAGCGRTDGTTGPGTEPPGPSAATLTAVPQPVRPAAPPMVAPGTAGTTRSAGPSSATPSRARPKPKAASTSSKAVAARSPGFPVPVQAGNATQVLTVDASGSRATVVAWVRTGGRWRVAHGPWRGRAGENGTVRGSSRRQGSGTTPTGTYPMTEAFGIAADPGTALPYLHVGKDDWWVGDNRSKYYNSHRRASQGGFDTSLPESDENGSEQLITHTRAYRYGVVIDFNRRPAVRYRGSAIFLHVNGSGATAGCVSIPAEAMVTVLRWLRPSAHPRIAIG